MHAGRGAARRAACPRSSRSMPCSYMRVPALVQRAEERVGEVVLAHARGDAHVAERELGHERVVRLVLAAALEVVAEAPDHLEPERELVGLGRVLAQARVVGQRLRGDGAHHRHQPRAQLGEQRAHRWRPSCRSRRSRSAGRRCARSRGRSRRSRRRQVERLLEQRPHARRSRSPGGPRSRPGRSARRARSSPRRTRPAPGPRARTRGASRAPARPRPSRRAGRRSRAPARRAAADRGVGELLVREPAQRRHLPAARRGAAGRHVGRLVPAQQRGRRAEVVHFEQLRP